MTNTSHPGRKYTKPTNKNYKVETLEILTWKFPPEKNISVKKSIPPYFICIIAGQWFQLGRLVPTYPMKIPL